MNATQTYNDEGMDIFLSLHRLAFAKERLNNPDKINSAPYALDLLRRNIEEDFRIQDAHPDADVAVGMLQDMKLIDENFAVPEQVADIFRDSIQVNLEVDQGECIYTCMFTPGRSALKAVPA